MYLKKHNHLDPKIWQTDKTLYTDVTDILLAIVWDFIDYVRTKHDMEIRNQDLKDVFLFGSITNYFYDKKSDIDICVVLDLETLNHKHPNLNILQTLKLYYYDWAMIHLCSIKGRKIDINFADVNNPIYGDRHRTGPNYSVLKQKWLFKPIIVSDEEFKQIKKQSYQLYKEIMHDYAIVKRNGYQIQDMELFFKRLMSIKKVIYHIHSEQVITPMYVVFQELKRHGIIKKLRNKMIQQQTKKFTLK